MPVDAALARDRRNALDAQQPAGDDIVDVPAQLLEGHVGRLGAHEQDRVADIDPVDLRLEDAVGQVAADLGDGVAHVVHRPVGRVPISNWTKVLLLPSWTELLISSTPLTERTADSTFCVIWFSISVGAAPGWLMLIDRRREVDVRIVLDLHAHERDQPGEHQADEEDDRRNRVADGPGRDVTEVHVNGFFTNSAGLALPAASERPLTRG